MSRGRERRVEKRSVTVVWCVLRAGALGSATMGRLLVGHTGATPATLTETALTEIL